MRYRALGHSGIQASVVGLGAWAIGGWMWGGADDDDSVRAIRAAIDAGMNLIDTAPMYGYGHSEEVVGQAIAGRRDKVVLATKCGLRWDLDGRHGKFHFAADDKEITQAEGAPYKVYRWNDPDSIRLECERSLQRLGTDHIDLYQTHWQDPTTAIEDTMAGLLKLKDEGKVRAIGVSNASTGDMDRYRAVGLLDADQEKYSMIDRKLDEESLPYCLKHNVAVLAYSPLANGLLTGKIGPDRTFNEGDLRATRPRFSADNRKKVAALLDAVRPIAAAHGVTPAQLAIAWAVAQPGLTHALVGARTPQQVAENGAAADVTLSGDDLKTIDAAIESHASEVA
jgi:methylglyoxal reductase